MWLKSHRWVDVPGTRTEKRWTMNVRESRHTAMVFDKKYVNVETGKLDTDRLHTLNNLSLNDLVTEETYDYMVYANWNRYKNRKKQKTTRKQPENKVYNFPKHVPKDNDFDEDIRRENLQRKIAYEQELKKQQDKEYAEARLREHTRLLEQQRIIEQRRIELAKKEEEYAKHLAEVEAKLMKERDERNERLKQAAYSRHVGNIIPNVWRPK